MNYKLTRRRALAGLSASLLLPTTLHRTAWGAVPKASALFQHGVASGDPEAESVLLWTRVSGQSDAVSGLWQVAKDPQFKRPIAGGTFTTDASRDYTVKAIASGLAPGKQYYYRFQVGEVYSPTGRTRTLPVGAVDRLCIAVASCSNYPFGYFNAYEAIARDGDVDLVLHLGDYIYEYAADSWGGNVGAELGRLHQPANEIVSLSDYRIRHAQYKADPQSQAMHAAHPLVAIWDDHESANNPWLEGAENHQPDTEGDWQSRKRASLKAYYEWMPIREPGESQSRADYWRNFQFGDLANMITLETRHTGRAKQIEYSDHIDTLKTPEDARRLMTEIVGAPDRELLGKTQEQFIGQSLRNSVAAGQTWHLIGNQIPMARTHMPALNADNLAYLKQGATDAGRERLDMMARGGALDLPIYLDPWDGYPAARQRFYQTATDAGANNLLVLTGDSHSFWQNTLFDDNGKAMGLELGTTGITSPGDFLDFGVDGAHRYDQLLASHNKEVDWTECRYNGFVKLTLTHQRARAEFLAVTNVLSRDYQLKSLRDVDIVQRDGTLAYHQC